MRSWRRHRVPFIEQGEHSECGLAAAAMILAAFGHPVTMDELRRRYGAPRGGLSLANIVTVLSDSGIRVRAVTTPSAEALKTVMTPCILHWDDNHFVVLDHYAYGRFRIADPANGRHAYTPGELAAHCSGAVLIPQPTNDGCATIPIRPRSGTVSILTGFLRRNMPAIGLSLLFSLVVQGLTLIVPAGTGYMVDHGSLAAQSGFPPLVATMLLASLLKLLAGLIEPVCGTVTINDGGCRIYDADSRWKADRLAYVHQESTVFNETLRDNITLHRPWLTDDDIVRACEVAGINEGMMDPVVGLDAMVSERGMNLSGGQRQKVAIARAVVGRPDFLLMDEPTSALDNDTERHVMTALLDSDNACIVVAHRLASIRDFDRIHVMDHGQIVESGTHDELLQAGGLYSRLYRQE